MPVTRAVATNIAPIMIEWPQPGKFVTLSSTPE
jgi:hypothetical protein